MVNFYQTTRRYNPEDSHLRTHSVTTWNPTRGNEIARREEGGRTVKASGVWRRGGGVTCGLEEQRGERRGRGER
jgi:hypothetical protein